MEKYIKPDTELIKVNTQETLLLGTSNTRATESACAPRYDSDDEDDTDVNSVW